jgi:hypothetical protein
MRSRRDRIFNSPEERIAVRLYRVSLSTALVFLSLSAAAAQTTPRAAVQTVAGGLDSRFQIGPGMHRLKGFQEVFEIMDETLLQMTDEIGLGSNRPLETRHETDERALPASRSAKDNKHLASIHFEGDVLENHLVSVGGHQLSHLYDRTSVHQKSMA